MGIPVKFQVEQNLVDSWKHNNFRFYVTELQT